MDNSAPGMARMTNTLTMTPPTSGSIRIVGLPLCPDLLSIDDLGEADGWRGHFVRAFFHGLKVVSGW